MDDIVCISVTPLVASFGRFLTARSVLYIFFFFFFVLFFFQAEDGIRDLVRSRGLGDVYKRQAHVRAATGTAITRHNCHPFRHGKHLFMHNGQIGGYGQVRRLLESLSLIHI